jgi:hypothetical protein
MAHPQDRLAREGLAIPPEVSGQSAEPEQTMRSPKPISQTVSTTTRHQCPARSRHNRAPAADVVDRKLLDNRQRIGLDAIVRGSVLGQNDATRPTASAAAA